MKSVTVTLRMSPEERAALQSGADRLGTSVSEYARLLIGDPTRAVKVHVETRTIEVPSRRELVRQVRTLGRNICAVIRGRQDVTYLDPQLVETLRRIGEDYQK